MASGSQADARVAELAALSGEKLVDLLRTTCRKTDFDAVARVLKARDRRFAEVKAALADIDALRKKHDKILGARRRPRDETEENPPLLGVASGDPARRNEPRVEELDHVHLSRPLKRLRQCETSPSKSEKRDGQGRSNSVGTLGNFGQKSSPAKSVHSVGPKERVGQLVGRSTPKDSKQGRGAVEPEKWGGGMARTAPPLSPWRSVPPKGSSKGDHGKGKARTGNKQSSSDGILGPPPKWNGKIINTPMVESSSRSAEVDTGTAMSLCGQTEDLMIEKGGTPVRETRMVAAPSLSIGTLSGAELRAYCLKPQRAPPASCMGTKRKKIHDLAKGGNGLSMKPVDVSSKKKLVFGEEHPST